MKNFQNCYFEGCKFTFYSTSGKLIKFKMDKVLHVRLANSEIPGVLEFSGNDMVIGGGNAMADGARDFAMQL